MKWISFVFASLISLSAMANFSGAWKGQGTLDDSEGAAVACKALSFDFSQTEQQFVLNSGEADCDLFKLQWQPFTIEVQDGELISNGDRIGSISDDFIFVKRYDVDSKMTSVYSLEISSAGLEYRQTSSDDEGNILFSIEGLLTK